MVDTSHPLASGTDGAGVLALGRSPAAETDPVTSPDAQMVVPQSPVRFLEGLGEAYRASGREAPPLDGFAYHPYPESSAVPPDRPHAQGCRGVP